MVKTFKILITLLVLIAIPALASLGVMTLWNSVLTSACGFAIITYYQAFEIFLIGQLLSCGFIFALFIGFWCIHAIIHKHSDWHEHWHNMSDEERIEFIQRRRNRFGFHNSHNKENASEQ